MKNIQKVLLPLNGTSNAEAALATALLFARQFGGHIAGLHVRADSRDVAPWPARACRARWSKT